MSKSQRTVYEPIDRLSGVPWNFVRLVCPSHEDKRPEYTLTNSHTGPCYQCSEDGCTASFPALVHEKLLDDIREAESKIGELKAKLRIAESKEKMQQLNEKIGGKSALGNFDSLADSIQKRIDAADAKEALNAELSGDMAMDDLEKKYASAAAGASSAQSELEALKARMGVAGAAPDAGSDAAAQLAAMKAQMGVE